MQDQEQLTLADAARELGEDAAVFKEVVQAYKRGGKAEALKLLPQVIAELKDDGPVLQAALPVVRSGYRTTEFWLTSGFLLVNAGLFGVTGHALPFDVNAAIGTVIAIYGGVRSLLKAKAQS